MKFMTMQWKPVCIPFSLNIVNFSLFSVFSGDFGAFFTTISFSSLSDFSESVLTNCVDFCALLDHLYIFYLFLIMKPTIGFPYSSLICLALLLYAGSSLILFHLFDTILQQFSWSSPDILLSCSIRKREYFFLGAFALKFAPAFALVLLPLFCRLIIFISSIQPFGISTEPHHIDIFPLCKGHCT